MFYERDIDLGKEVIGADRIVESWEVISQESEITPNLGLRSMSSLRMAATET
jgi:hypothetical protein